MPQLLLISSDPHIIETVQSLSDYDVLLVPEITTANHAEILAKMADVAIALIDTAAVGDMSFYEKIGESWHDDTPKIPIILLSNEDELDNLNAILEKPLVDFLTKPFSAVALKHRIMQSLRREKHKADSIAEYIGNLISDLNSPFTPLVAISDMLRMGLVGELDLREEIVQKLLQTMRESISRTWHMIEIYRNYAYVEANRPLWKVLGKASLKSLFQKNISVFERIIKDREQQLIIEIPDDLPTVECDEKHIDFVIYELLHNAIYRADEDGKLHIQVFLEDKFVHVIIQNNGKGISQEDLIHIFVYSHELKLTRHIIEKHGGRIWIESEVNKGTTVHFTLPVAAEAMA